MRATARPCDVIVTVRPPFTCPSSAEKFLLASAAVTAAPDRPTAAAALQELLGVAADEAHAVLQMQWGRLTGDTLPRIEEDVRELRADLRDLGDDR